MISNTLPSSLVDNPRLSQWLGFEVSGRVRLSTGKVELGQGVLTALAQIAAEELDVALKRIDVHSGQTGATPAEGFTAGSLSIETGGGSIRLVAAEVRALLLAKAAEKLGVDATTLSLNDGAVLWNGAATGVGLWDVADLVDLNRNATGMVPVKAASTYGLVGQSAPRLDLPARIFGGAPEVNRARQATAIAASAPFIHDLALPGMVYARVLRQPWPGAELAPIAADVMARIGAMGADVVVLQNFAAVSAPSGGGADSAYESLARTAQWSGGIPLKPEEAEPRSLLLLKGAARIVDVPSQAPARPVTGKLSAAYTKPYSAHASIGTSCALARFRDGQLTVWTHSQGVYPLRAALATFLHLKPEAIAVIHAPGAGCYGHNGADDVAADAALLAIAKPGVVVRVLWSRADELTASPLSPAMVVAISAETDAQGLPVTWDIDVTSPTHLQRPSMFGSVNLLAALALPDGTPAKPTQDVSDANGGGGARNAIALYDIPKQRLLHHFLPTVPPRVSAMRGLGALANVFAIECFVDELARAANIDPIVYRLMMLSDKRGRAVLEHVRAMSAWDDNKAQRGEGYGRGVAFSRYKNRAGYMALVVDVAVGADVVVGRVWCAVDAGLVINPDGARNQIEGGVIQALSIALKERLSFDDGRVAVAGWEQYPILKFSEVPQIDIALISDAGNPALGLGEVAHGPTAAALGNAIADALGVRIRDLPFDRERIIGAIAAG